MDIAVDGFLNDLFCLVGPEKLADCGLLVFKLLVNGEKVHYFIKNVRRKLVDALDMVIVRVGHSNGDYLVVKFSAVDHSHNADGVDLNERHGQYCLRADYEYVKGVAVVGVGSRNKAVVCGIVRRGVEHSVKAQKSRALVKLVFAVAALRYLHQSRKILGGDKGRIDIVPNVHVFLLKPYNRAKVLRRKFRQPDRFLKQVP